jgi:hypothetical protein
MNIDSLAQATPALFDTTNMPIVDCDQIIQRFRDNSGFIPVAVTEDEYVVCLDVGDAELPEWKFRFAIEQLARTQGLGAYFAVPLHCLGEVDLSQHIPLNDPTGFIFHMSKCGSTLMSRVLEQAASIQVIKEPTPLHENLWQYLTRHWQQEVTASQENLRIVRNIIQLLGRPRHATQKAYFVRFRSWNIAFSKIIQQAFPQSASLFMYREPTHVMASILNKPTTGLPRLNDCGAAAYITGQSQAALQAMSALDYFTLFYQHYLELGLQLCDQHQAHCLNYKHMKPENLTKILQDTWQYQASDTDLTRMQAQFSVYSKDDSGKINFISDASEKQKQVTAEMQANSDRYLSGLFQTLENHSANISRTLSPAAIG